MNNYKNISRDECLDIVYGMAEKYVKTKKRSVYKEMIEIMNNWNDAHADETEIFSAEDENENGEDIFYIEDDYFKF